ncbi:MAG: CotH kinase family protein [Vicinamibacterales bacterium]
MSILPKVRALVVGVLLVPALASAQTSDELFAPDVLHDVFLRINTRDLEELRASYDLNTYYPADIQIGTEVARNVAIRSRGRASRNPSKLGLRVDIDHFVADQTFFHLNSLVLDNFVQDPSMLREHAAMALFTRMGQAAPRTAFGRLFINDEYQGVYGLVEEPNEAFVSRHFGADKGYLFEYHRIGPYYFDDLGEDLATYQALFEPRTQERAAPNLLYAPLRELVRGEDGESLNDWRARVSAYLDLNELVTIVAIEEFLSEYDGLTGYAGANNVYIHRPKGSERHVFIPWDRDQSFFDVYSPIYLRANENRLVRQALAFPDLNAFYLAQVAEVARISGDGDWLQRVIQRADALIAPSAKADPRKPFTVDEREGAVRGLVDFAQRRSELVLEQIRQLPPPAVQP